MVYELKPLCLALVKQLNRYMNGHAIDYYGAMATMRAMKRIFARVALVRMALEL